MAVERIAGCRLDLLRVPAGFCGGIVVVTLLLELGVEGRVVVAATALVALLGLVLSAVEVRNHRAGPFWRDRAKLWFYGAAFCAYALAMAPLVGSGRAGVLGYILNNDSSVHLSVIELLRAPLIGPDHFNDSSFDIVSGLFVDGYPLGSDVWPMFGAVLAGIPAFYLWTPAIALSLAVLALVTTYLLRTLSAGAVFASIGGLAVALGYLPFSYAAQGGAKEIVFICCLYATLAFGHFGLQGEQSVRRMFPALVGSVASVATFGPGAAAWLAPAFVPLVAWFAWRERHRLRTRTAAIRTLVAVAVAVAVALPAAISALQYARSAGPTLADSRQIGNLIGPVPWTEAFNVWLNDDYRDGRPYFETSTQILRAIAILAALTGLIWMLRRRRFAIPVALASCAFAIAILTPRYTIYIDAKTYLALAPALGLCSAAGVLALWLSGGRRRLLAGVVSMILLGGLAASNALVYSSVWVTPKDRFNELIQIAERVGSRGPLLFHDRDDYGKYFLRDAKPWGSWGPWIPDRGLRDGLVAAPPPHTPDFDDYTARHVALFNVLVERRRPGGSLPASNFKVWFKTERYTVWQRVGADPVDHLSLGRMNVSGVEPLNCADPSLVAMLEAARDQQLRLVISVQAGEYVVVRPDQLNQIPAPWLTIPGIPVLRRTQQNQLLTTSVELQAGQRYSVFLQGSMAKGFQLFHNGKPYEQALGDLGLFDGWHKLGKIEAVGDRRDELVFFGLGKPKWQSGFRRQDIVGDVVLQPESPQRIRKIIEPRELKRYCGELVDWVELHRDS